MCGACCALAEQLMAIADDVDDVADECDALLRRAAEADRASAEPLQVLASLRVLQGRSDEALEALRQSMAIWRRDRKGTAGGGGDQADDRATEFEGEYDVSFEFRFECAKLLLELDESTDAAMDVLEELLEERDDVADVWHLLALANHGCCEFDRALEMLDRAEALYARGGAGDGGGPPGDGETDTDGNGTGLADGVKADLAELRSAIEESKASWNGE